jgi:hypothetical protein
MITLGHYGSYSLGITCAMYFNQSGESGECLIKKGPIFGKINDCNSVEFDANRR